MSGRDEEGLMALASRGVRRTLRAMLNYVWSFLLLTGLIAGALFGRLEPMLKSVFETCSFVVTGIALPLAGIMMLWLGVLRVMEKAGLMEVVARALSPLLRLIFPDVPRNHPAMGSITMNIAANMLGLGNAATPMGLKAMEHLQELNPHKQSASNAMCMFLALNTAGFALIPISAITYLNAGGVASPHSIIGPAIIATFCATIAGIIAAKLFQGLPMFRVLPDDDAAPGRTENGAQAARAASGPSVFRMLLICIAAGGFLFGAVLQFAPSFRERVLKVTGMTATLEAAAERKHVAEQRKAELASADAAAPVAEASWWRTAILGVSVIAIPAILLIVILWGLARGVPVYEEMVEGAKEGFGVATRIMPFLVVMLTGMIVFRESGALMLLEHVLRPVLNLIGMPVELFPLAIMRPLSGSGSVGLLNDIILNPASTDFLRYTAAILYGSTETTFYVLAVYFGSVSIRRTRHALAAGLCADVVGMTAAVLLGRMMFGALA
jgi:spore maturation protein SpmA